MDDNKTIGSTSFTFSGINWSKVGAGIGVAVAGAVLTYLTTWISGQDFGATWTPIVMTFWTSISVVARKWFSSIE
jgi:hypothetical protein